MPLHLAMCTLSSIVNFWPNSHKFCVSPLIANELYGQGLYILNSLHLKYGPVVRIAPGEVCFTSYDALKKIYGSQGSGFDETEFYDLLTVFGLRKHARRRRLLSDRYANSNIVNPSSLNGIRINATSFIERSGTSANASVDVYIMC
ncbi:hypothetical protein BU25DRAFT_426193 [Macroventuria anomochaeta]|uniref:Uncharacterized protein n=1 Tax=Macroventuria anomochaeta TaxID=301207 RepID=A0ACB6RIP6_9PLEO|nr:uncharacterized protein BU25DRAFT_426193 [Macroventuria anomochaeta]KAF2621761.1 hypothetical protein BU25DRAFT_426193 [Macroventuria anomochaeta]